MAPGLISSYGIRIAMLSGKGSPIVTFATRHTMGGPGNKQMTTILIWNKMSLAYDLKH